MAERHSDHPGTPPVAPAERRASARVPLDRPVRIGPPGGYPHASVTARDLSPGGLFIDAERDVRVGARFSVAIPLRSGHDAYIPEAEVVDNRSGTERGFGVRFVKLSAEARRALEDEVSDRAYVTLRTIPVSQEPHSFDDVDFPTMDPMPVPGPAFFDEDVAAANLAMASVLPSAKAKASAPTALVRARTRWMKMKSWLRSVPILSGLLYVGAVVAVVAVGVLVMLESRSISTPPVVEDIADAPELQTQLVEGAAPAGLEEAPPRPPGEVVNPLPEPTEEPRRSAFVPRRAGGVFSSRDRAGAAGADETAPPSRETAPELEATDPFDSELDVLPSEEVEPVPGLPASERGGEDAWDEPRQPQQPERRTRDTREAPPRTVRPGTRAVDAASPISLPDGTTSLSIRVGPSARIRKSYVLRQPERFVIDVINTVDAPELPDGRGPVRKVRFGRHEGFNRFVVDTKRSLESGRAVVRDGRLELTLEFR